MFIDAKRLKSLLIPFRRLKSKHLLTHRDKHKHTEDSITQFYKYFEYISTKKMEVLLLIEEN